MDKEFSLIKFLERIVFLEEKFFSFISDSKKIKKTEFQDLKYIQEMLVNDILLELIPITDSMENFVKNFNINQNKEMEILVLIFKLIKKFYKKFNIKQISKIGIYFDPNLHEAIGMCSGLEKNKGIIKNVLQNGYVRNNILIRPALVIIYN
ncbi:chaperone protein GrpE [Candidatus Carsonella ruddii HT isolate Thao2000]|uniref:Chaperone protein GrpE n=1 Tax=Candidatus Carsonella ruddii HT isolate Thao2000 TaxID=1202539 RepID=J3YQA8_CARRU|nr:nucleotide exchange factor GrpE [Candidatus Carsonella ruddii]AFP84108.1 chaperone protein GrpE [Candidatus Carsonella ruddii HT isolate Thao2000]